MAEIFNFLNFDKRKKKGYKKSSIWKHKNYRSLFITKININLNPKITGSLSHNFATPSQFPYGLRLLRYGI